MRQGSGYCTDPCLEHGSSEPTCLHHHVPVKEYQRILFTTTNSTTQPTTSIFLATDLATRSPAILQSCLSVCNLALPLPQTVIQLLHPGKGLKYHCSGHTWFPETPYPDLFPPGLSQFQGQDLDRNIHRNRSVQKRSKFCCQ